jgi:hypothetical protein
MGINIRPDRVEVFKNRPSGIVALCAEVAEFVRSGEAARRGLDVDAAWFEEDESGLRVAFPEKSPITVTLLARDAALAVEHLRFLTDRRAENGNEAAAYQSTRYVADKIKEALGHG